MLNAWAHLSAAEAIAGGGAAQPLAIYLKTGIDKSDADLRREIRIATSGIAADLGTATRQALIDVATHVHLARLKLTTDPPNVTFEDTRKRMAKFARETETSPPTRIRKNLTVIEEALGAL